MLPRGSEWSRRGSIWMQLLVADTELEEGELARSCTLLHFAALCCTRLQLSLGAWRPETGPGHQGQQGRGQNLGRALVRNI